VRSIMQGESSGHDWWHVWRVRRIVEDIALQEKADLLVVGLAALLHDLDDYKLNAGVNSDELVKASAWLKQLDISADIQAHVCEIIRNLSFSKNIGRTEAPRTIEGKVVQDAERVDGIGAIGIARVFAYGGAKGRMIYDPDIKPVKFTTPDEYKNSVSTSINHFYEKVLLLKDTLNTETAKRMAEEGHKYMMSFLDRFFLEWDGAG